MCIRDRVTVVILTVVICVSIFAKGIFNLMPILFAIIAGYLVCLPLGFCDFTAVREMCIRDRAEAVENRRKISEAGRKISLEISGWNDRVGKIPFKVNTDDWNYILVNDWNPLPAAFKPQLDVLDDGHQVDYRIVDEMCIRDRKEETGGRRPPHPACF